MKTVGINGFGRIGRLVFRILNNEKEFEIKGINASYTPEQIAHLIQFDSIHGFYECKIEINENAIIVNGNEIKIYNERDPEKIPWGRDGIEYIIESTGAFTKKEGCRKHIRAGARKVVLTAPAKDDMKMIVMGVNEKSYDGEEIVSNASCTTNCLGPLVKILNDNFGIKDGLMTTIHAMTNDQRIIDNMHKDLRRARSGGLNMIPTSTGAAKALGKIIPELEGKLNGIAVRVPTHDVSMVDFVVELKKNITKEKLNSVMKEESEKTNGILTYNDLPLVSSDYQTTSQSGTIDGLSTMIMGDNKAKIIVWYDNEWGYSNRVVDLLKYISQ